MSLRTVRPGEASGHLDAPPSKSYTHRALLVSHLARRLFRILRPLLSADTIATRRGLAALGSSVEVRPGRWTVRPAHPTTPRGRPAVVNCGESGTTFRLLLAAASARPEAIRFVGRPQLRRRPIDGLTGPLSSAGVRVTREGPLSLPLQVQGPLQAGRFVVDGSTSSQYLSALLLVLPTLAGPSRLRPSGRLVSVPYLRATEAVAAAHGIRWRRRSGEWIIPGAQSYRGTEFSVPGDASSAAYLLVAGALTGGSVRVDHLPRSWPQADRAVVGLLRAAGVDVTETEESVRVQGRVAHPFRLDLTDAPDLFPLAGVVAAQIPGRSELRGAPHLAFKESDRRAETARLVRAFGGRVTLKGERFSVTGTRRPRAVRLTDLDDHRLVMSAAVGALGASGPSRIGAAEAVRKSYPRFWTDLARLGAEVTRVG